MWNSQITDKLSWTNAARVDYQKLKETGTLASGVFYVPSDYSHDITAFTANSDIVYKATDHDSFRAGYGRGVQFPSFLQYGFAQVYAFGFPSPAAAAAANLSDPTMGLVVDYEGNPSLKPTYVQDYSADYDRKVDEIFSHVKVSLFYELNQDLVESFIGSTQTFQFNGNPITVFTPGNVGNSKAWGGEIEIKGSHPSGFRWDASYSYSHVVDSSAVQYNLDYEGSAPMHHFRLLLGYTTGNWEFDANGQLVTSTDMLRGPAFVPTPNDGYQSLSARIGYRINDHLTFAVSGFNLNSNVQNVSPYPGVERQIFASITGKF